MSEEHYCISKTELEYLAGNWVQCFLFLVLVGSLLMLIVWEANPLLDLA
jgi:hypothetical protein